MLDSQREKSKSQFIMTLIAWGPEADPPALRSKPGIGRRITTKKERAGYKTPYPA